MSLLLDTWKNQRGRVIGVSSKLAGIGTVLFCSYIVATTLSAGFIAFLGADSVKQAEQPILALSNPVKIRKLTNFLTVRRRVLDRLLFNSNGDLPDESEPEGDDPDKPAVKAVFDENAKCPQKTSLNIELLGTIAMGAKNPGSLASIMEKGYTVTDIYRVGEPIYGQEQATIHAIYHRKVVINNNGKKECLELKEPKSVFNDGVADNGSAAEVPVDKPQRPPIGSSEGDRFTLENSYVTDVLSNGFAKILKQGRLVPFTRDNRLVGFKLIGVKKGSLFAKVGLSSGDVLIGVNGTSMAQAEQGFAFYTALSDEKEIRVDVLRKGKEPSTITIEVR